MTEWTLDHVPAEAMALWCEALRDDNAIHVDPAAADALGFGPRTVNPGPINLAYLLNMVMTARPDEHVQAVDAVLQGNVLAGDAVLARGEWDANSCEAELVVLPDKTVLRARITTKG